MSLFSCFRMCFEKSVSFSKIISCAICLYLFCDFKYHAIYCEIYKGIKQEVDSDIKNHKYVLFTEIPTIGTDYLILMITKGVRINKVDNKTANQ